MLKLIHNQQNKLLNFLASFAIGIVGDAGVRGTAQQPRLFVGMILILIFAEVLGSLRYLFYDTVEYFLTSSGLYGLIVALLMNSRAADGSKC